MIRDLAAVLGTAMIGAGATVRFGWDMGCIIVGAIILLVAVIGALRT